MKQDGKMCFQVNTLEQKLRVSAEYNKFPLIRNSIFHLRPKNVSYNTRLNGNEGQRFLYPWPCAEFTHCTRDLLVGLKHSCITKVSSKRDLRSKVQHLQCDLHLEVQYLTTLCVPRVSLLFSSVIYHSICKT